MAPAAMARHRLRLLKGLENPRQAQQHASKDKVQHIIPRQPLATKSIPQENQGDGQKNRPQTMNRRHGGGPDGEYIQQRLDTPFNVSNASGEGVLRRLLAYRKPAAGAVEKG